MKLTKVLIALTVVVSLFASPALTKNASAGLPKLDLTKVNDVNLGITTTSKGIKAYNREIDKITTKAKKRKTALEKIYYVHNSLIEKYKIARNDLPSVGSYGTAYYTVTKRSGDSLGFAHLNYHILKKLGIKSEVVLTKDKKHAWNKVKLGGKYYNVDVYNDGEYNHVDFNSFMVSDKMFKRYDESLLADSKIKSTDTRYDYFAEAHTAMKFTDKEIYYSYRDYGKPLYQIRKVSITGKDSLVYQPAKDWSHVIRWNKYVYYQKRYDKTKDEPRLKIFRVSYDGKEVTEMIDTDCIIVTIGENGIRLTHHITHNYEYINFN